MEKYRKGTNSAGFLMQMYYSTDGETWTSAGDDFKTVFTADGATEGYTVAPGDTRTVNADLMLKVKAGDDLFLAWNYSVASGTDAQSAQALGLDNVKLVSSPVTTITTQPVPASVCPGSANEFSVSAIGTGAVTYQWYNAGDNNPVNNETGNTFTTDVAGSYYVKVSSECGTEATAMQSRGSIELILSK